MRSKWDLLIHQYTHNKRIVNSLENLFEEFFYFFFFCIRWTKKAVRTNKFCDKQGTIFFYILFFIFIILGNGKKRKIINIKTNDNDITFNAQS